MYTDNYKTLDEIIEEYKALANTFILPMSNSEENKMQKALHSRLQEICAKAQSDIDAAPVNKKDFVRGFTFEKLKSLRDILLVLRKAAHNSSVPPKLAGFAATLTVFCGEEAEVIVD